jgi:hypothetical protein
MRVLALVLACGVVAGCAGRDPQPIPLVQSTDATASCAQLRAEIQANNIRAQELADEKGVKVAQNVAAAAVGLIIWPVWFGMDLKDAAGKEAAALQARQQYLSTVAEEKCAVSAPRAPSARAR